MKFGKEFAAQMVQEWQDAYMDYNHLKLLLKDVLNFRRGNASSPIAVTPNGSSLKRRLSMYRAFSGLTSQFSFKGSPRKSEDEVILINAAHKQEGSEGQYRTTFLMASEEGGEYELVFFRRLDNEFNKVLKFYKEKLQEMNTEAEELSKQMDALIGLRIKVDNPLISPTKSSASSPASVSVHVNNQKGPENSEVF